MKVIFRLAKLKTKEKINDWKSHNFREKFQQNIKKEDSYKNVVLMDSLNMGEKEKSISIDDYYKLREAKIKKDNVLAVDGIISMSPEFFDKFDVHQWAEHQVDFLKSYFKESVKEIVLHLDEKTPHIHFLMTTERKTVKSYSNRYKKKVFKESVTLNTKWMDKFALSQLQQGIYEHNKEKYDLLLPPTRKSPNQEKRDYVPLKEYYASIANRNDELVLENEQLKKENTRLKTELEKEKIIDEVSNRLWNNLSLSSPNPIPK